MLYGQIPLQIAILIDISTPHELNGMGIQTKIKHNGFWTGDMQIALNIDLWPRARKRY